MSFSDQTLLAQTTNFPDRIWNLVRDFPVPRPNDRNFGARIPSSQAIFDFWQNSKYGLGTGNSRTVCGTNGARIPSSQAIFGTQVPSSQTTLGLWHKRYASSQTALRADKLATMKN